MATSREMEAERRRALTGVDPGGQGAVSGQVAPGTVAGGAPGTTGVPGVADPNRPNPANQNGSTGGWRGGSRYGTLTAPQASAALGQGVAAVAPLFGETRTGALTAGAPPTAPGATPPPALAPGTTTTRGTVPGYNPLGPTVSTAVGAVPIVGDIANGLLTTSRTDTGPGVAAQNAAFGLGGNLDQERYNFKPGDAAYQERVALEKAQQDEIRQRQLRSLDALEGAANGGVMSAADIQMKREGARSAARNLGAARALGGRSAGGVARAATLANAESALDLNSRLAEQRAQETAQARSLLTAAQSGVRGQDVDVAGRDASLAQAANENNLNSQIHTDDRAQDWRKTLLDNQLKAYGIGTSAANSIVDANQATAAAENKAKGGYLTTIGNALGLKL